MAYQRGVSNGMTKLAKQRAFCRARKELKEKGLMGEWGLFCWFVPVRVDE